MRITNHQLTHSLIAQITGNGAKLAEAQERVSSGLRVRKMSDDPAAASTIMGTSSALRSITQFQRNAQSVGAELDAEDSALSSIGDVLIRAKELAGQQVGANATTQTRAIAAQEVKALIDQVVQLGNTKHGTGYLFGGASAAATPPFDRAQLASPIYVSAPGGTPVLPQGMRKVEVGPGQTMQGAHDGDTVLVQSNVLQSLQSLYTSLTTDSPSGIATATTAIDASFDSVQGLVGDVGARRAHVDAIEASLGATEANLTTMKSGLAEVDAEEAITEMMARQTAYQAAMLASSKVMGLSLTDYLR